MSRPARGPGRRPLARARRCRRTPGAARVVPFAEAKLGSPPERPPKFSPSYAGAFALDAPAARGSTRSPCRREAGFDRPGRQFLKAVSFSEATGCANARRSVKFRLAAEPTTLQLTGVGAPDIAIIVSPE